MKDTLNQLLSFFKFQNKLKMVYRNNQTLDGRKETSAEHSWSVSMMAWLLTKSVQEEKHIKLDSEKIIKMSLIHDIVEIYAGDVEAWNKDARDAIKEDEMLAITKIAEKFEEGTDHEIYNLWVEHEERKTVESKLVKACDQLCPLIYRIVFDNSYSGTGMTRKKLDDLFLPIVGFSQTTSDLYMTIASELESQKLFDMTAHD